jgi:parvulin-like peptidyl-prolyl isomerase
MIFPIIIIALVSFTGLIVLQWGAQMTDRDRYASGNYAAMINGEEVSWRQFRQTLDNLRGQQTEATDEELTDAEIRQLEEAAWNQILQNYLLLQEAEKYHLKVTEEEIYQFLRYSPPQFLQDIPQFQTDGQFDYQTYFSTMLDPQAAQFWESIRQIVVEDILKLKVQHLIIQTALVSDEEVKQFFMDNEEKVRAGLVNVSISQFDRPQNTDEEQQLYYQEHQQDYWMDERAVLKYVSIDLKASEADWERTYRRSKIIYDSIQAGGDFAEMAQMYGEDATSEKGGDLGWFSADRMVEEFSEIAFTMEDGDLSEPFRTQFGWHIVKHHGYRTQMKPKRGTAEKEEVKEAHASHILLKTIASNETLDAIDSRLQDFVLLAGEKGFDVAAIESHLPVKVTSPFTAQGPIESLGTHRASMDLAFQGQVEDISDVMETKAFLFVAFLAERIPAGVAPFEDIKNGIDSDLRTEKLKTMCTDTAGVIYAAVQSGSSLGQAAEEHGIEYTETDLITRSSYIMGVGKNPPVLGAAFSLTEVGQVSKPVDHATGTVILELLERTSPDLTEFIEKQDSLSSALMMAKQQELYSRWFEKLVDGAKIESNIAGLN